MDFIPTADQVVAAVRLSCGGGTPNKKAHIVSPVLKELIADLDTPVSAFLKLRGMPPRHAPSHGPVPPASAAAPPSHAYLLESVEGGERLGRYSIVGFAPHAVLTVGDSAACTHAGDPLTHVQAWLEQQQLVTDAATRHHLPAAFTGGAVGYVAYDAVRHFEPRTAAALGRQQDTLQVPEAVLLLCDDVVLFDHVRHTIKIVCHARLACADAADEGAVRAAYRDACDRIDEVADVLSGPLPCTATAAAGGGASSPRERSLSSFSSAAVAAPLSPPQVLRTSSSAAGADGAAALPAAASALAFDYEAGSNMGREGYEAAVRALKGNIVDGDVIQAVPSHRISRTLPDGVSAFDVYRNLRVVNPSPYMFFIECGPALHIVGASPEMLVKVTADGAVQTHPIAGTRRRGATPAEDAALAAELLGDAKEVAEHVMLVDLGRNDIGRVAAPGSVAVEGLMRIEAYSHVQHIVTTVTGRLAPGRTAFDAFRAVFPAGTVSGAPKVRAVELVAGLESQRRGVYAGAVGYWAYGGAMDTAIAIRTMVVRGQRRAHLQAGAGIVYDSVPAAEYDETIAKMRGVMRAVDAACTAAAARRGAAAAAGSRG